MNPAQPTFPGLELGHPTAGHHAPTQLELAAKTTLTELRDAGRLRPEHAMTVQLVLDLARAVGQGVLGGKASAVAMAVRELREVMAMLPMPTAEDDGPAEGADWQAFLATAEAAPAAEAGAA